MNNQDTTSTNITPERVISTAAKCGPQKLASGQRSEAEWRELIERQRESGLSVKEFCKREHLSKNRMFEWRRKLHVSSAKDKFIEVNISGSSHSGWDAELDCGNGLQIRARNGASRELLTTLISIQAC